MKRRVVNSALALSLSAAMVCGTVFSGTAVYAAENIDTAESVEDGSASSNAKKAIYKDGEYYGVGKGRNGEIKLKVTIEDGKISSIENESNVETKRFWNKAVKLFETIVNANSTDVESISGATRSSEGIKQAVEDALEQAEDHGVFDGGSGTKEDPYIIKTAEQLKDFAASVDEGNTYKGQYVELDADVDLGDIDSWNPIGAEAKASDNIDSLFDGTFDGKDHTITDLRISENYSAEANVGLFSSLNNSAVVKNVDLKNVDIEVSNDADVLRAGAVAGDIVSGGGRIDNVAVSGEIRANEQVKAQLHTGAIVGRVNKDGVLTNVYSDVKITAECPVEKPMVYVGGVTGIAGNNAIIANAASKGEINVKTPNNANGNNYIGGIAGMFSGYLWNVYSLSDIAIVNAGVEETYTGEIVGWMMASKGDTSRKLLYYASDAKVERTSAAGAGESQEVKAFGTTFDNIAEAASKKKADMQSAEFAAELNGNVKTMSSYIDKLGLSDITFKSWTAAEDGVILDDKDWEKDVTLADIFESGAGTKEDPYIIKTVEQLRNFALSLSDTQDYTGEYVKLGGDVDASGEEWTPVGRSDYAFNGDFDGDGFVISGLKVGTEEKASALTRDTRYLGLFGGLGEKSRVHDLNVSDIYFNVTAEFSAFVGGIAGFMDSDAEDDNSGAVIDNVKTSGKISVYSTKSNSFAAGIAAYQFKGAIINSSSDMDISCIVKDEALAEVGSIVGLNNRGLNANLYSTGKIYGSGSRENGLEGMAVVSGIAGVQAGSEVNCYTDADLETAEYSIYAGMLSGWITGIGKTYDSWFDKNASMVIDGKSVNPPESVGTVVAPDVSDEDGTAYVGGLTKDIKSYDADSYKSIAVSMNELFEEFPVDITEFGLSASALRKWKYDEASKRVVFDTAYGTVKYVKPEVENVKEETVSANNGTWYGRSEDKSTVVKIVVKNNEIESTEVLSGNDSGEKFDEAFKKAKEKAVYGDFTDYEAADVSKFAGGEGTEEKPYLISNEEQLRYLAESINEDVDWKGVWFRQTADITLSDKEWLPIGRSLQVRVNGSPSIVAIYPFRGSFDGGNHVIKNLKMGTEAEPYNGFSVGLFGVTEGDFNSNKLQSASVNRVTLKNIKLRDVDINAEIEMATRAGGLIGAGEDGIFIDNCSVTGNIEVNTQDSYDQVGSVAGYLLRGGMLNTWSDVELKAFANKSTVYAGGIMGMQNRVTTVNCYSLGDVSVGSGNNNKATAGGIVGLDGGVIVNSYASGNVSSSKTTFDLGIISGRAAGISEERGNYYNSDAEILNQGTEIEARPIGTDVTKSAVSNNFARSAEFMAGSEFADELNANRLGISRILSEVKEELGTDEDGNSAGHSVYYNGDCSELREWKAENGVVGFEEVSPEEPTPSENTTEPSISGNNAEPSATSGNSAVSGNGTTSGNGAVSGNDTASGNKAVSENDAVSANEIVSTVTKKLSDDVSITYKEAVSFNGKKTVFGAEDITVTVDGAEYKGDKLKLRYKNNQKAGEATFYIKGIKGASKAQRKLLKQVKKTALTFKVDKLALTGENSEIRLSKSGAVKSVKAVVNGKKLKLKKSEYSANAGIITISGERFSGELKY